MNNIEQTQTTHLCIGDVMTSFTVSVSLDTPISQAMAFMREHSIHHLPVTKDETLIGVISARDVQILKGIDPQTSEDSLTVQDAYIDEPYRADVDTPLKHVLNTMANHHYGSVLVTRDEKLVGMFTMTDACRYYAESLTA